MTARLPRWLSLGLLLALVLALGSFVPAVTAAPAQRSELRRAETSLQYGYFFINTFYYSDATYTTRVGHHSQNTCSGEEYQYGEVTAYAQQSMTAIHCD